MGQVMDFMSENGYEELEINKMKARFGFGKRKISEVIQNIMPTIKKEKLECKSKVEEEFVDQFYLPPKWTEKKSTNGVESTFISPGGETFDSRFSAVKFLIKTKSNPQIIFKLWSTLDSEGWVLGGKLLPAGWRVKFHERLFD